MENIKDFREKNYFFLTWHVHWGLASASDPCSYYSPPWAKKSQSRASPVGAAWGKRAQCDLTLRCSWKHIFHMYLGRIQILKRTNVPIFTSWNNFTVKLHLMDGGGFEVGCQILLYSSREHWTSFLQGVRWFVGKKQLFFWILFSSSFRIAFS